MLFKIQKAQDEVTKCLNEQAKSMKSGKAVVCILPANPD